MSETLRNIRHDIHSDIVTAAVEKKIAEAERLSAGDATRAKEALVRYEKDVASGKGHLWRCKPDPGQPKKRLENAIRIEREHYSTVRVIERPNKEKPFILVYGDVDDATVSTGTGGFDTYEDAGKWFTGGGR